MKVKIFDLKTKLYVTLRASIAVGKPFAKQTISKLFYLPIPNSLNFDRLKTQGGTIALKIQEVHAALVLITLPLNP